MATGRATKASLTRPGRLPLGASRKVGHLLLGAGTRTRQKDSALLAGRHRSIWSALAAPAPLWHKPVGGEVMPDFKIERCCAGLVCGIDEAGRGPLAGPVVAAAVGLDPRRFPKTLRDTLDDSNALTIEERETCYRALRRCVDRWGARVGA